MTRVRGLFGSYSIDDAVLNRGGVGAIHRTSDPALVYKRYLSPLKAPRREHLTRLIEVGREVLIQQQKEPGDTPESSINWPVDMVVGDGDSLNGVVLPTIPLAFFVADLGAVRTLDFLVRVRARPPSAKARVALLLRMAEILRFINDCGLVHGDINGKNLAWTLEPKPIMYLIDCDGMLPQSPPPTTGVGAHGWMDPRVLDRVVPSHDHYSDWYCLALAMYRGLLLTPGNLEKTADGDWPAPSKIPPELHTRVAQLIRRGLSDPLSSPKLRPTPNEWVDTLLQVYVPDGRFDDNALAILDRRSEPKHFFVPLPTINWDSESTSPFVPSPPRGVWRPITPPTSNRRVTQPPHRQPSPLWTPAYGQSTVGSHQSVAVIFIHGLFSSSRIWDHFNTVIEADSDLSGLVFLPFEYASPKVKFHPVRCIPGFNVLAESLKTFIEHDAKQYERLVLVSHSQGGLIVQRFLSRMLHCGRGFDLARIKHIVMFACPNSGSQFFLTVRGLLVPWRHPQERDLRPISDSVIDAQRIVLNQVVYADGLAYHKCPIRIHAYAGERDNIVSPASAQFIFPDSGVVPGDHASIIKPDSLSHRAYTVLKSHLVSVLDQRHEEVGEVEPGGEEHGGFSSPGVNG